MMVHCLPLITLLTTHQSYGFLSNPSSSERNRDRSSKNNLKASTVPYRDFKAPLYMVGVFLFPSYTTYCFHSEFIFIRVRKIDPCSLMNVSSLDLVCRKAPGTSTVATSRLSLAAIALVIKMDSTAAVGEDVSSFVLYTRCGRPSSQPRALILPLDFIC